MKDKTIAYALFIAMGIVVIAIAALILIPKIRTMLNDADAQKPTFPISITGAIDNGKSNSEMTIVHYELPTT